MFKQSPRRNGRNKGLKIKHVLQISVLLGVTIWLLYQVHHSDDKKLSVTTNIADKPRNDSSKDMLKLGRKDLRPKVNQTTKKETEEHLLDDQGIKNEDNESVPDQGSYDITKEVEENEHADGIEKNTKTDHEQKGVDYETIFQMLQQDQHGANKGEVIKEENKQKKSLEKGDKEYEEEHRKQSVASGKESKNEDKGIQKEVKEAHMTYRKDNKLSEEIKGKLIENKSNEQNKVVVMDKIEKEDQTKKEDGKKMSANTKDIEILDPSEIHDQREENESGKSTTRGIKGPTLNGSQFGSNQSHNDTSSDAAAASEKERKSDENKNMVVAQTISIKQSVQQINTIPDSDLVPSVDLKTENSVNGSLADSTNSTENVEGDIDSDARDMEQVPNDNKDDASVLEEEKDALIDLGTLPNSERGGSISQEDSDTE